MALDAPLTFERKEGKLLSTRILTLNGPLTLRNLFELQAELRTDPQPKLSILDLSGVPYMDSAGMGLVINHYVHCQNAGTKMIAVGVSPRVHELFKMTRVDTVIPQAATAESAEASS
jgi:anti-sigma B factor antagonist